MAEDHGISVPELDFGADTESPTNVDDLNLTETQTTPAQPIPRWTEMSFTLILSEIKSMWVPITRAGSQSESLFTELKTRLHDRYLQHADMDIPIQRQGVMVAQLLTSKLEVQIRQKALQRRSSANADADADPNPEAASALLALACHALELGLDMWSDDLLRGTRWLTSTYTQFHLLTYILWHLCVYPTGPHVARAWRSVNRHFDLAENDPSWPDPGPKWPVLVGLRAKAYKIRQALDVPSVTGAPVIPEDGALGATGACMAAAPPATVASVGNGGSRMVTGGLNGDLGVAIEGMNDGLVQNAQALLDMNVWDLNWVDVPDWNYLAQSLAVMGQEGSYPVG